MKGALIFWVLLAAVSAVQADERILTPGQEFDPQLCIWQQPVSSSAVVDPDGATAIDHHASTRFYMSVTEWSFPIYYVDGSDPTAYTLEDIYVSTDWHPAGHLIRNVPIPTNVTMKPDPTSDGALCIIDTYHRLEWDFWACSLNADGSWKRTSYNGKSYYTCQMPDRYYLDSLGSSYIGESAKGSGFAYATGLIRPDELKAGKIPHVLAMSIFDPASGGPMPPATNNDEEDPLFYPDALPDGVRMRLKPSIWTDAKIEAQGWNQTEKAIAYALRDYGAIVSDGTNPKGMIQIYGENPTYYSDPYAGIDGMNIDSGGGVDLFSPEFFNSTNFEVIDSRKQLPYADRMADTDNDGIPNAAEIAFGYLDSYLNDPGNATADPDGDGLTNLDEWNVFKTWFFPSNPHSKDSDNDGVDDAAEIAAGTDPTDPFSVSDPDAFSVTVSATPTSGDVPLQVQFSSTVTNGAAPLTYSWDFDDGTAPASESAPTHTFSQAGSYTVRLTVTDANGQSAAGSVSVAAGSVNPDVVLEWSKLMVRGPDRNRQYTVRGKLTVSNDGNALDNTALSIVVNDTQNSQTTARKALGTEIYSRDLGTLAEGEYHRLAFRTKTDLPTDQASLDFTALLESGGVLQCELSKSAEGGVDLSSQWLDYSVNDDVIRGKLTVENDGKLCSSSFMVKVYLSDDKIIDASDVLLLRRPKTIRKLPPGRNRRISFRFRSDKTVSSGYLIILTDSENDIAETDESNNEAIAEIQ